MSDPVISDRDEGFSEYEDEFDAQSLDEKTLNLILNDLYGNARDSVIVLFSKMILGSHPELPLDHADTPDEVVMLAQLSSEQIPQLKNFYLELKVYEDSGIHMIYSITLAQPDILLKDLVLGNVVHAIPYSPTHSDACDILADKVITASKLSDLWARNLKLDNTPAQAMMADMKARMNGRDWMLCVALALGYLEYAKKTGTQPFKMDFAVSTVPDSKIQEALKEKVSNVFEPLINRKYAVPLYIWCDYTLDRWAENDGVELLRYYVEYYETEKENGRY